MMTKARIMVVEDDRVVARDIREQLARIGHSVVGVTSLGEDAMELALETRPDLVLMDIRLEGDLDGIDAAQKIRTRCHIPVVFLTAYADDETVRRASHAEPFGYLLKPFEDSQLRTVIEMALYKHAAERKLRESERRYEATLSSIGDGVIATDEAGRITFINPVAEALTGWSKREATGKPLNSVYRVTGGDEEMSHDCLMALILESGRSCKSIDRSSLISRDGREIPIDEKGSPIIDDAGSVAGAVLVFSDTSDRKKAADALRNAQTDLARIARITTMGQLTTSIAHEVNQPLMAVVMNADACLSWLDESRLNLTEARAAAGRAVNEGHRAGKIIERIRALARNAPAIFDTLDINSMVESVLAVVRSELKYRGLVFRVDLHPGQLPVVGDRIQLQQVMLNLLSNAADAIHASRNGEFHLAIGTEMIGSGDVRVSVADSGDGIDPAIVDRIFSPFFTTKREGIGIGLSICRSIIDLHGGRLWAEPQASSGTRFCFELPPCQL